MKTLRFNYVVPCIWAITAGLAVILLVKGVQSVFFGIRFPDHQFFTLIILVVTSWMTTGPRELAVARCALRNTRKKAAQQYSYIRATVRREARSLASLFTFQPMNRPQTEP
jgi:hypothetical protein